MQLIEDLFCQPFVRSHTCGRGDYLLREGETEYHFYRVETGAVRIFRLTETEEQSIRFGYAGSLVTSISSFLTGTPSGFFIQALRKTTVLSVHKNRLDEYLAANPHAWGNYAGLLAATITGQLERETDLLTAAPAERLQRVLQRSPRLFQEIPLKYIASYLRMTPETLSRLRKS
jgi:CRP-like cAMP-binding protein